MDIFPAIQPELFERNESTTDNVCVDVAWENGEPVLEKGSPVFVSGAEAVKGWVERCLKTERGESEAQSADYGIALSEMIIGKTNAQGIEDEISRALLQNEYILEVEDVRTEKTEVGFEIACRLTTMEEDEVEIYVV